VARDAEIQIDGKPAGLTGLPAGARVDVGLSVDRKAVRVIRAEGPAWRVVVKAVDADKGTITFDDEKAPAELAGRTFPVPEDADIQIDGKPVKLTVLQPGVGVTVRLSVDRKTVRGIAVGR
jgi:hypothetical protein